MMIFHEHTLFSLSKYQDTESSLVTSTNKDEELISMSIVLTHCTTLYVIYDNCSLLTKIVQNYTTLLLNEGNDGIPLFEYAKYLMIICEVD